MDRCNIVCALAAASLLISGVAPSANAQQIKIPERAATSDSAFIAWLPQLSRTYTPPTIDNRMRAAIVAGDYQRALADIAETGSPLLTIAYEIYAATKLAGRDDALSRVFAELTRRLDDRTTAHQLRYAMGTPLVVLRANLLRSVSSLRTKDSLSIAEAVTVIRQYAGVLTYELLSPSSEKLLAEDDARRYVITRDIQVQTPRGGVVCALVVRRRSLQGKQTTLLNFSVYESDNTMNEARRSASNGYVGVEGLTRGKGCSPNKPVSHEYDGVDAAGLIDWIARQPWSDGRVGMYGGSYDGFTQWAAAKHMPKALKAMMPPVTHAPGIDFPIDGNVFVSYAYPWPLYTTNKKRGLDSTTYNDATRWTRLNTEWYRSGRAYKDLPLIDGAPNPTFLRWLSHSTYDAYWQNMIPYKDEFARINIPILTTTGYFDGGQMGALWYFRQHKKYAPNAEHYLLIGPYDHVSGQRGTIDPLGRRVVTNIQNVELDSISNIDLGELRYQWFNYVFKNAPKPAILADKVNYEVMGADEWKHAPTLEAMHSAMRVALDKPIVQIIDLADRSDVERWGASGDLLDPSSSVRSLIDTTTNIANSFMFSSPVLANGGEVSGLFSGQISFVTNKKDFDYSVTLFELTNEGKYVQLNYHWGRASYAKDRSKRVLLIPGKRTTLPFENNRLTSKRVGKGSRIVVVIAVMKNPSQQINYGTGKVVAEETIKDAGEKLRIEWLPGTFVEVPFTP